MELWCQRLQGCCLDRFCLGRSGPFVSAETETVQLAYKFAFNGYFTGIAINFGHHGFLLS